ncbi:unnamed protein product [Closterium sp. NIES-65]|nr:unnamed protein product [Closterium sp. NIES-65]
MEDPRRDAVAVIGALVTRPTLRRQAEVIRRCFSPRVRFTHFLVDVASGAADLTCIYQTRGEGASERREVEQVGDAGRGERGEGKGEGGEGKGEEGEGKGVRREGRRGRRVGVLDMAHVVLQYQGVRVHRVLYDPVEDALSLYVTVFTRPLFKLGFLAHFDLCVLLELEDIPLEEYPLHGLTPLPLPPTKEGRTLEPSAATPSAIPPTPATAGSASASEAGGSSQFAGEEGRGAARTAAALPAAVRQLKRVKFQRDFFQRNPVISHLPFIGDIYNAHLPRLLVGEAQARLFKALRFLLSLLLLREDARGLLGRWDDE